MVFPSRESEPEDFVGEKVANRIGLTSNVVSPDLTALVAEYCLHSGGVIAEIE